jgi:adenylate cyclase
MDILNKDLNVLRAVLFLVDEEKQAIFPVESIGMEISEEELGISIPLNEENALTISLEKRMIIASDAFHQDGRLAEMVVSNPLATCKIAVPLTSDHGAAGVIALQELSRELDSEDMRLLSAISSLAGMSLANASDLESSKKLSEEQLRERKKLEGIFSKYVSPSVVDQLLSDPDMQMLGGKKQKITLLFTDIRGFTSMAEQMSPEEIVGLLNEYFSQMSELILTYQGTLDKFMGDAIMALYGAPIIKMDDSLRAVTTAVEMQKVVNQINESRAAEGLQTIAMGIGLNTGECIVGNIGSEKRLEYTAIGDSVNIASRLCSAAKGGQILISESTYLEMAEMIDVKVLDPINVKGKADALKIYEVTKLR